METCYEYFGCNKTDCVMFTKDKGIINCWDFKDTLCNHPYIVTLIEEKCKFCLYHRDVRPKYEQLYK